MPDMKSMRWAWGRRADQKFDWRGKVDPNPNYLYHPFEQKSGTKWDYSTATMLELQYAPADKDIFCEIIPHLSAV